MEIPHSFQVENPMKKLKGSHEFARMLLERERGREGMMESGKEGEKRTEGWNDRGTEGGEKGSSLSPSPNMAQDKTQWRRLSMAGIHKTQD